MPKAGSLALAVAALVAIGTAESFVSVQGLSQQVGRGRPTLAPSGALTSTVGFLASCAVYLWLGRWLRSGSEREAVRAGALTGFFAGALGGTIRALAVDGYLSDALAGFWLPGAFVVAALAVFVALSVLASAAGGAVLTWLSWRFPRSRRSPP